MAVTWITDDGSTVLPPEPDEYDPDGSGTQRETWNPDKLTATVTLKQTWDDRHLTLYNILANGLEWPYNDSGMRALSGSMMPLKGKNETVSTSGLSWDHALITVNFETAQATSGDPSILYQEELTPSGEMLSLDPADFRWASDDAALKDEEAPSRLEFGFDYVVRWFNLLTIPTEVLTHVNKTNNGTVSSPSLGLSFAQGTLLMNPCRVSRTVALGTINRYSLEARWSYRANTWHKYWRAKTQAYDTLETTAGSAYYNFPEVDMSGLLP